MTAAEAGAAVAADGVDLVDEDDRRRRRLGLLEQVAHADGADADEHLDEVGAARSRRTARPASPATARASSVLPVPGGPKSSTPFGILAPIAWNLAGRLEEVLDLLQLLDRLVGPATSAKVTLGWSFDDRLRLGLAELHDPAAAALHLAQHEHEDEPTSSTNGSRLSSRLDPAGSAAGDRRRTSSTSAFDERLA